MIHLILSCVAEVASPFQIIYIATRIKYRVLIYLRRIRNLSAKGWLICGLIPGKVKCSFLSTKIPDRLGGPPSIILNGHRCHFHGLKRPGRYVEGSNPFIPEIKTVWSYISTPCICLWAWIGKISPISPFTAPAIITPLSKSWYYLSN